MLLTLANCFISSTNLESLPSPASVGFLGSLVKNLPAMQEMQDTWVQSLGGGNSNPLHYSCWENPMDRGAWPTTVHGTAKSWTQLSTRAPAPRVGMERAAEAALRLLRTLMLGKIEGRRRRGWQRKRWMASPIQWTWTWEDSGRWGGTGQPGVLQSMGSRGGRHDLVTEQQQCWYYSFTVVVWKGKPLNQLKIPFGQNITNRSSVTSMKWISWTLTHWLVLHKMWAYIYCRAWRNKRLCVYILPL